MKKLTFLFVSIYLTLTNLSAQDIVFTFNAKDATNTIDSIKATKIATGEHAFVKGSNTIKLNSFSTGTNLMTSSFDAIKVVPNPFDNHAELQFYSDNNDEIKVLLINALGQIVAEDNQSICQGFQRFNIVTKTEGIYIVNVAGNNKSFSAKIISTINNQNTDNIKYKGFTNEMKAKKSASIQEVEVIHFMIYSGENITKIADSPTESKTYEVEFHACKDIDGRSYPIIQIGEQWWMAENLAYNIGNGCWAYDNNENNVATYGRLYSWETAKTACPTGWHLPTDDEWKQLEMAIGMSQSEADDEGLRGTNEGTKLKATNSWTNNGNGTDDFGFSALPGGQRNRTDDTFGNVGDYGNWWSATEYYSYSAWHRNLGYDTTDVGRYDNNKAYGFSVRCVRN